MLQLYPGLALRKCIGSQHHLAQCTPYFQQMDIGIAYLNNAQYLVMVHVLHFNTAQTVAVQRLYAYKNNNKQHGAQPDQELGLDFHAFKKL